MTQAKENHCLTLAPSVTYIFCHHGKYIASETKQLILTSVCQVFSMMEERMYHIMYQLPGIIKSKPNN